MASKHLLAALAVVLMTGSQAQARDYKVGALEALTNAYAFAGVPLNNGLILATEDLNTSGFLGKDNRIVLDSQDGAGDRQQAVALVHRFINDPQVIAVVGPTSSNDVFASGPSANTAKLPMMTNAGTPTVLGIGPYVFKITESIDDFMTTIGRFAVDKLKLRKCAFITISDSEAYGRQRDIVRKILVDAGGKVAADELVKANETDFAAVATKVVEAKPDCLAVNSTSDQTVTIIRQMKDHGLPNDVRIILNNTAASTAFINAGGKAVEGAYVITSFLSPGVTEEARRFSAAYQKRFNAEADDWAALGYSSMQAIAYAIKNSGENPTRESVRDELAKLKNVPIVAGSGRLTIGEGRLPTYGMIIVTIKDGKFVPVGDI